MFILIKTRGIPSEKYPQWGIFEMEQAAALRKAGHRVVALSVDFRSRLIKRKWGMMKGKYKGVDYYNLYIPFPYVLLPKSWSLRLKDFYLDYIYKKYIAKEGRPDVVHAHYAFGIEETIALSKKHNIPLVGTEHWSIVLTGNISERQKAMMKTAYGAVDRLITVSGHLQGAIKGMFGIDSDVVANVVDVDVFKKQDVSGRKQREFRFCTVGNLITRKGFDVLIDAFKQADFSEEVVLDIVGSGPLGEALQEQIDDLGLGNKVRLVGQKSREELVDIMRESDVFALCSRSETFGVVFIEAMSVGLPIVSTRCGGADDIVTPEVGVLVDVDDVVAMAKALLTMKNNIGSYDADRIVGICMEKYSPAAVSKELEKVYKEL